MATDRQFHPTYRLFYPDIRVFCLWKSSVCILPEPLLNHPFRVHDEIAKLRPVKPFDGFDNAVIQVAFWDIIERYLSGVRIHRHKEFKVVNVGRGLPEFADVADARERGRQPGLFEDLPLRSLKNRIVFFYETASRWYPPLASIFRMAVKHKEDVFAVDEQARGPYTMFHNFLPSFNCGSTVAHQ